VVLNLFQLVTHQKLVNFTNCICETLFILNNSLFRMIAPSVKKKKPYMRNVGQQFPDFVFLRRSTSTNKIAMSSCSCNKASISSTFYACFFHQYFGDKNLQSQMNPEKSCSVCFRTKDARVKRWWNLHTEKHSQTLLMILSPN